MRTRLRSLAATGLAALGLLAATVPAGAASANEDLLDLANFELRPNSMGDELKNRVALLDEQLPNVGVGSIIADANRQGELGDAYTPCNSAAAGDQLSSVHKSICFNSGDGSTGLWMPQGVTTVADAQDDQHWGEENQPVLVSWYDSSDDGVEKGTRVTFVDPHTGKYRHVLLVYPTINSYGNPSYMSLRNEQTSGGKSLHAGGIVWYGNFLYVADTNRGFRVFDMRHIYDLGAASNGDTEDSDKIGRHDGTYYGHGYRYVMPQVGSWTRTAPTGTKCTTADGSPQFSHVSLDRSGADHLVAGEYCAGTEQVNGRVAAWPIAGAFDANNELVTDTSYRWNADAAHKLPVSNVQGATRFNGRWYLSRSRGTSTAGTFYTTEPATSSTTTLQVASSQQLSIGPEDLSHWQSGTDPANPGLGDFWTVAEHPGKRMVYAVRP